MLLSHPVLPTDWPFPNCVFSPQYDNPVMRGTFSSHLSLNIATEVSEVQFIIQEDEQTPPEHDLRHPELEASSRNASFYSLIRKGASGVPLPHLSNACCYLW